MKKVEVSHSVAFTAEHLKKSLQEKGFTIFCDIDHQENAKAVNLDMPASRSLIFGNPTAGTKLMLKDIAISLDLPLRIAIVENNSQTVVIHQTTEGFCSSYLVEGHPVLDKIEALFAALLSEL